MSTYNGWTIQTYPTIYTGAGTLIVPASIEAKYNAMVGTTTSPFSGQQQVIAWDSTGFYELSVSYGGMSVAQGQTFGAFLVSLNGPTCVFKFPSSLCTLLPVELGSTPTYFRLKGNTVGWSIKEGVIYGLTFEVRTAI